jgi:NAD(P)-dependent dehydrogenase (short-subunit alcohol dehydrogenase family)
MKKRMLTMNSDDDFETLEKDILESLEINLLGAIKTVHAFVPLIRNGKGKKVIAISSGMADIDLINATEVAFASPYAISKGALNVAIAKYNALYNKEGILFLAVSPGYVSTERNQGMSRDVLIYCHECTY